MGSTQINCGKPITPWREDPKLQSRFHPDYPDDLQVLIHDGGLRTTDKQPELVWVRVCDGCSPWYSGTVLNKPLHLLSVHQGSTIHFVVPQGGEDILMVTGQYIQERPDWIIEPCDRCGLTELFDEPSKPLKITFPDLHVPEGRPVMITFSTFCGSCGGTLVVSSRTPVSK
jgi:hypothetical protein